METIKVNKTSVFSHHLDKTWYVLWWAPSHSLSGGMNHFFQCSSCVGSVTPSTTSLLCREVSRDFSTTSLDWENVIITKISHSQSNCIGIIQQIQNMLGLLGCTHCFCIAFTFWGIQSENNSVLAPQGRQKGSVFLSIFMGMSGCAVLHSLCLVCCSLLNITNYCYQNYTHSGIFSYNCIKRNVQFSLSRSGGWEQKKRTEGQHHFKYY